MLSVGFSLQVVLKGKIKRDDTMSKNDLVDITKYSLLAISGMFVASWMLPQVFTPSTIVPLSTTDSIIYGQIFAITEEVFFRGAVTYFIFWIFPSGFHLGLMGFVVPHQIFVSVLSGSVFAFYHLARYGFSQATVYVWIAGVILAAVVIYSKRISPAILAHMSNNFLAVLT